ncbi:GAF sensor signal transduction histidine kinase [Chondrocystis sp. NIES-4102]|nr:GAF sensor signal transduction histidine kinase [Chondrocystis sp. NIES-4102]
MSDSSGSILQLQPKIMVLSNVKLLIVTSKVLDCMAIATTLEAGGINFTYDLIATQELSGNLPRQKYNAILYNYAAIVTETGVNSLSEKLQWWCHLYPHTPLILITDTLGDEQAVELIQSGVNGYVLRENLDKLPEVLQKTIINFISNQTVIAAQQDLIKQQQEKIAQLEAEKQTWLAQQQAKQEYISHLNHELRSPISSIISFATMLKEQYYGRLNTKQMQYVTLLHNVGKHMLDLVNNYLDLVKIDANKQSLELERLAVEEVCQAALFMVAEKANQKGLQLNFKLAENIDFCTADSLRLKQILVNLLSNAIKFTEKGSITLQVTLQGERIYFAVNDTGIGIAKNNLTKLFQPFPQITTHHESTGLGLTLSKKLAQLHGGDITVTSVLGKGSCFTLDIPQHQ